MIELDKGTLFIGTKSADQFQKAGVYMLGIPYDGSTSFRPGSRFGASAAREASFGLETYSPYLDLDIEENPIFDMGNLPFYPSRFERSLENFAELTQTFDKKHKLLTIGGEHSISYMPMKKYIELYPDLVILHLDAHTDLRDGYLDDPYSHASVIRRTVEHLQDPSQQLIQYGIRSGLKEEFTWMKENQTLCTSLEELIKRLADIDSPIYMTLDLDFFDPSYLPGTGTPEAGGEDFHSFMKIMKVLNQKSFVGADIVELAPQIDPTGNSSCFASKVIRETALALS